MILFLYICFKFSSSLPCCNFGLFRRFFFNLVINDLMFASKNMVIHLSKIILLLSLSFIIPAPGEITYALSLLINLNNVLFSILRNSSSPYNLKKSLILRFVIFSISRSISKKALLISFASILPIVVFPTPVIPIRIILFCKFSINLF